MPPTPLESENYGVFHEFGDQESDRWAESSAMTTGKPRKSADPLYLLLREGRGDEFNRRVGAGEICDLRSCDFRGIDLRSMDPGNTDFSDCYFRQADLRGLDLRNCKLEGASLHAAHISGAYFPVSLAPAEIEISVRLGTRLRLSR